MTFDPQSLAVETVSSGTTFLPFPHPREALSVPHGWTESSSKDDVDAIVLTAPIPDRMLDLLLRNVGGPLLSLIHI